MDVQISSETVTQIQGPDLVLWRERNDDSRAELMVELDMGSRQTVSSRENSEGNLPRLVELALHALASDPICRRRAGKKASAKEKRDFFRGAKK